MKDDPRTWLNEHIEAGIHLRVEARMVLDPGTTWRERADKWERDLIAGVEAHSPRHAPKVRTVGDVVPETQPVGHVWFEKAAVGLAHTSTGEGLPGNNPLSRLSARIRRAEEVAALWEHDPPEPIDAVPFAKKTRGRPSDKQATEKFYRKLAAEIDKRGKGVTIRDVCADIAIRPDVAKRDIIAATIERETLPYRKKRGRKIPRSNFPRR
jgi:hypothetical protein